MYVFPPDRHSFEGDLCHHSPQIDTALKGIKLFEKVMCEAQDLCMTFLSVEDGCGDCGKGKCELKL